MGSIATAMILTGLGTAAAQTARGRRPSASIFVGIGAAGTLLMLIGQASPDLAAKLAQLVLVSGVIVNGGQLASSLTRYLQRG